MLAPHLMQDPLSVRVAELDQCGERVQGGLNVPCLLGDNHQMVVLSIVGERDAEAVEDSSARWRYEPQTDAVFISQHLVAISVDDLQLVQAGRESGQKHCLAAGQDRGASAETLVALCFPLHCLYPSGWASKPPCQLRGHQSALGSA